MTSLAFGKYRGWPLEDVPLGYLAWLFEEGRIDARLRSALRREIVGRIGTSVDRTPEPRQLPSREIADAATELIVAGYRAAAKGRHPDTGGSHEAMLACGAARDYLQRAVEMGVAA